MEAIYSGPSSEASTSEFREAFRCPDSGGARVVALDGIVTQRLADLAAEKGLKYLVGMRERLVRKPEGIEILTQRDVEGELSGSRAEAKRVRSGSSFVE